MVPIGYASSGSSLPPTRAASWTLCGSWARPLTADAQSFGSSRSAGGDARERGLHVEQAVARRAVRARAREVLRRGCQRRRHAARVPRRVLGPDERCGTGDERARERGSVRCRPELRSGTDERRHDHARACRPARRGRPGGRAPSSATPPSCSLPSAPTPRTCGWDAGKVVLPGIRAVPRWRRRRACRPAAARAGSRSAPGSAGCSADTFTIWTSPMLRNQAKAAIRFCAIVARLHACRLTMRAIASPASGATPLTPMSEPTARDQARDLVPWLSSSVTVTTIPG